MERQKERKRDGWREGGMEERREEKKKGWKEKKNLVMFSIRKLNTIEKDKYE